MLLPTVSSVPRFRLSNPAYPTVSTWDGEESQLDLERKKDVERAMRKTQLEKYDESLDYNKVKLIGHK